MDSSPTNSQPPLPARSHWLNWAVFLGMSWTWCIGMFLPVLFVREYGIAGWVVFSIPNVLGAAAMGWVLRSAQSSVEIASTHRIAAQLFSAVTIAFHFFFVISVITPLALSMISPASCLNLALGGVLVGGALMYLYMTHHRRAGDRFLAWIVLVISLVAMVFVTLEIHDIALTTPDRLAKIHWIKSAGGLAALLPVSIFGFLACPYLDLTFHRARQHSANSRASFGVGFGGFFFAMIIFTLIYSRALLTSTGRTPWIAIFLFIHMSVQTAFTVAAHARELQESRGQWASFVAAGLTVAAWAVYWLVQDGPFIGKYTVGEVIYRVFMGFYGLLFPAYVWLIMLPARRGRPSLTVRNLTVYLVTVLLTLPFFFMGFVVNQMVWLLPGLTLVLLARLLISFNPVQQNSAPI